MSWSNLQPGWHACSGESIVIVDEIFRATYGKKAYYLSATSRISLEQVVELAKFVRQHESPCVTAIGGGTILDAVKLASIATHLEYNSIAQRGSLGYYLDPDIRRDFAVHAIPTTPGTGSEVSSVAVYSLADGSAKLIQNPAMRPVGYATEAALLEKLPRTLKIAGAIEILGRVLPTMVFGQGGAPLPVEALSRSLSIADNVVEILMRGEFTASDQLRLAQLSRQAQHQNLTQFWRTSPNPLWCLAMETADENGKSKVQALAPLLCVWLRLETSLRFQLEAFATPWTSRKLASVIETFTSDWPRIIPDASASKRAISRWRLTEIQSKAIHEVVAYF